MKVHLFTKMLAAAVVLAVGAVVSTTPLQAGLISISTGTLSSNGAEITNPGTVVSAWNVFGDEGGSPTVNGVTFLDPQPANISIAGLTVTTGNWAPNSPHYDATMTEIMEDMLLSPFNGTPTVTITGLTIGETYQVQLGHQQDIDDTSATFRLMQVFFGTTAGTSTGFFDAGDDQGYITTALFTADATSQLFTMNTGTTIGNDRVVLNFVSVTTVVASAPEPSTLVLALLGIVGLAVRRRRR